MVVSVEFFRDMIDLKNWNSSSTIESLWRHMDGRLFQTHKTRGDDSDEKVREVTFDEALAWLTRMQGDDSEVRLPGPAKFLALRGVTSPKGSASGAVKQAPSKPAAPLTDVVDLLVALSNHPEVLSAHDFWNAVPMLCRFARFQVSNIRQIIHGRMKLISQQNPGDLPKADQRAVVQKLDRFRNVCSRLLQQSEYPIRETVAMCIPPATANN